MKLESEEKRKYMLKELITMDSNKEQRSSLKIEYSEWLTSIEASEYLGISVSRLMNLTSNGKIPYYKFGRSNRYLVSELKALLMSHPKGERHGN